MIFSYRRALVSTPAGLTYVYRPLLSVLVMGPQGSDMVIAMADSGSDDVILPRSIVPHLGVTVDDSQATPLTSITGHQLTMVPGDVELELSDGVETCRWRATVFFVTYPDPQYQAAIFGHFGGLALFTAIFRGPQQELELTPPTTFPGTVRRP
jgi:hypothetical protein